MLVCDKTQTCINDGRDRTHDNGECTTDNTNGETKATVRTGDETVWRADGMRLRKVKLQA